MLPYPPSGVCLHTCHMWLSPSCYSIYGHIFSDLGYAAVWLLAIPMHSYHDAHQLLASYPGTWKNRRGAPSIHCLRMHVKIHYIFRINVVCIYSNYMQTTDQMKSGWVLVGVQGPDDLNLKSGEYIMPLCLWLVTKFHKIAAWTKRTWLFNDDKLLITIGIITGLEVNF